jgi:hypothetical protein
MIDTIIEGWSIDRICKLTRNAETLNALHACRPDHPWNKTAKNPWRNAWFLATQRPIWEIPSSALDWLHKRSDAEA